MDEIFRRLLDSGFSQLKGLAAAASVPIPQDLINEIVAAALHGNRHIESARVSIDTQNRISVDLKAAILPWPLTQILTIEQVVAMTPSPTVRARLENNRLLGKLGSIFKALPDGVSLEGDQVAVDLASFLRPEQRNLLGLVRTAAIKTEPGRVMLDLTMTVE